MAVYSKGKIAIPNVTGNIVIEIEAVQSAPHYTNLADKTGEDWYMNYRQSAGSEGLVAYNGRETSNTFEVATGDVIRVKNVAGRDNLDVALLYPSEGAITGGNNTIDKSAWSYDAATGILSHTMGDVGANKYLRLTFYSNGITDDIIITRNENIV